MILDLMRDLFMIERELPDFRVMVDKAERKAALETIRKTRDEKSRPLLERIESTLREARVLSQSSIGKAIAYAANHWQGLKVFLDDPRVPMSNNQAERTLRSPVVGRKNHYGSKSRRGTEVAAIFYSLIGTCCMLEIDPSKYIHAAAKVALVTPGAILLPQEFKMQLAR